MHQTCERLHCDNHPRLMTRGNQREKDRVRNIKRKAMDAKKHSGGNNKKTQDDQAEIMRAKQKEADERKQSASITS